MRNFEFIHIINYIIEKEIHIFVQENNYKKNVLMKQFKINKNYTNRSEESLDKHLVEINRIPMITPDQEVELAQIIRKGGKKGEEAKNKLVTANLRFRCLRCQAIPKT